jgi:16S rRNA (cytosine967-C5)-methyltransferase
MTQQNRTSDMRRRGAGRDVDARRLAHQALTAHEQRPVYVSQVLDDLFAEWRPAGPVRALATEMACGIVRRQRTLDAVLSLHATRPREELEPELWTLLRLGAYQLLLMRTAPHAAIHETVQLAKRMNRVRWVAFANGVLRGVQRDLTDEYVGEPGADALPVGVSSASAPDGSTGDVGEATAIRFRRLRRPVFPSPDADWAPSVAAAFSYPDWLVQRWRERLGEPETLRLCAWFNTPGRTALRVNLLKTDRNKALDVLRTAGVAASPGGLPEAIRLDGTIRVENVPGFAEGWFSVQDESALAAAALLDPQPGERVLDLCAAPGGKTTHLAERMQNCGSVLACDVNPDRLRLVDDSARRLGLTIIETRAVQADLSDLPPGPFDRVLVDVPCSNTGVLGKRPEVRWRISPEGIAELAALQRHLLCAAAERLAPGGRLVYSTCSIEPEENEAVVRALLEARPDLQPGAEQRHQPGLPADGGYQALLVRPSP